MKINIKKNLFTTTLLGTILLSGCQSSSVVDDIKKSESVILKENSEPLVLKKDEIAKEKIKIFQEGGFSSIESIDIDPDVKSKILSENIVFFDFDSYKLSEKSKNIINQHIAFLKANTMIKVIVEGHTDEKGEKSYNLTLGEKRANIVKEYIVNNDIDPERVEVISYGETKPLYSSSDEDSYSKNRRSQIIYN